MNGANRQVFERTQPLQPNPVYAQQLAAAKELKNARKNQLGGWAFFGIGLFAVAVGLVNGTFYLLWCAMGVVGLMYALNSARQMPELKAKVASVSQAVAQAQPGAGPSQPTGGQFG